MNNKTSNQLIDDLAGLTLYKRFEGSAVYTQESNGKYSVVIDETSIASLLPPEELDDMELIKIIEFNTEQERLAYLVSRFGLIDTNKRCLLAGVLFANLGTSLTLNVECLN